MSTNPKLLPSPFRPQQKATVEVVKTQVIQAETKKVLEEKPAPVTIDEKKAIPVDVPPIATLKSTPAIVKEHLSINTINIIDKSTTVDEKSFQAMCEACQIQLEHHVAPLWGKESWNLVFNQPENVGFPIVIVDDSDSAGRLGYHTQSPGGKVWARVFVNSIKKAGGSLLQGPLSVSAILSHEVVEAYCDPNVNLWAVRADGQLVAYEIVDPVEDDYYDITISNGTKVSVSNFVLPSWFNYQAPQDDRFDYMKKVGKPFAMTKGGYMVTMNPLTGVIKNVFGSKEGEAIHDIRQQPHPASRSTRKRLKISKTAF